MLDYTEKKKKAMKLHNNGCGYKTMRKQHNTSRIQLQQWLGKNRKSHTSEGTVAIWQTDG